MKNSFSTIAGAAFSAVLAFLLAGCFDEQHPGSYYTFTDHTVASYLEENSEALLLNLLKI